MNSNDPQGDVQCFPTSGSVSVTYTDTHDIQRRVDASGSGGAGVTVYDVASGYKTTHSASYYYCRCSSPEYHTTPK